MGSGLSAIEKKLLQERKILMDDMNSLLAVIISEIMDAAVPSIKILNFENFKNRVEFPNYYDLYDSKQLLSVDQIDRENSFIVYISHSWIRISPECDGGPHPDSKNNDKYKLCIEGINRAFRKFADGMKYCYIWMDYCCVAKDSSVEFKRLDNLMELADCIFTPIVDPDIIMRYKNHKDTSMYKHIENYFDEYPAVGWGTGPSAYLNRSCCRLEMYYAATIPLPTSNNNSARQSTNGIVGGWSSKSTKSASSPRSQRFSSDFRYHVTNGRRPHLLYGDFEDLARQAPYILPSFHNKHNFFQTYFDRYVPVEGHLCNEEDRAVIAAWTVKVLSHIEAIEQQATDAMKDGYEGERNEAGEYHGQGAFRYLESGEVYEGHWKAGRRDGFGVFRYRDGSVYEGHWKRDLKHGQLLLSLFKLV